MKKLFTLVLLFCSLQSFGQLKLVRETKNKFVPFRLSTSEWMLFSETRVESKMKSVTIYNKDYSIYKVIQIPQTFPYDTLGYKNSINLSAVGLIRDDDDPDGNLIISDKFFNDDSKLELVIGYNSYLTKDNKTIRKSSILIINEDGLEIAKISNPDGDLRLTFWGYLDVDYIDYNNPSNEIINTKIYSVPGNLPCSSSCSQKSASIAPITQTNEFKEIQVTGFPNPSSEKVTLAYTLPEGTQFGTLRLYTQTGELVKEFKVSNQVDHLELPVSEYNSGTYFYELQAGGSSSGGKKMVVIH
jgi:hypothetical protein